MATSIAKFSVVLGADSSALTSKLGGAAKAIGGFATGAAGALSALGTATMSAGKYFMSFADNDAAKAVGALTRLSTMTGASTEALAGLQLASGQDTDTFSASMMMLTKNLAGVEVGSEGVRNKLKHLGLDADKLAKMPLDQAILEIADTFEKLPSSTEKAALAFTLFGKKGGDAMKILGRGKGGLEAAIKKAGDFGLGFSAKEGKEVGEALKAVKEYKLLKEGFTRQIALNLAPIATPVAKLFTDVGVGIMKGFKLAWDAARPFKDWLQSLSKSGLGAIGSAIGGGIAKVVAKAGELLPIATAWATTFAAGAEAIGRWELFGDIVTALVPSLKLLDVDLSGIKEQALLVAWAFEYGFKNAGKSIELVGAKLDVAGTKVALFLVNMADSFDRGLTYVKEIGEWAAKGLGELFSRMLDTATAKFKALGTAIEKFFKDPSAGWQYTAPPDADYKTAFGEAPKYKDAAHPAVQLLIKGVQNALDKAEAKAAGLENAFGKGLLEFIKTKQKELAMMTPGTMFLGFDLTKFIGAPPPPAATPEKAQGTSAAVLGTLEAAQAELKFWREEQGKSAEAQALAEAKRQSAYQAAMLKELQESNNPTRWDLIF